MVGGLLVGWTGLLLFEGHPRKSVTLQFTASPPPLPKQGSAPLGPDCLPLPANHSGEGERGDCGWQMSELIKGEREGAVEGRVFGTKC